MDLARVRILIFYLSVGLFVNPIQYTVWFSNRKHSTAGYAFYTLLVGLWFERVLHLSDEILLFSINMYEYAYFLVRKLGSGKVSMRLLHKLIFFVKTFEKCLLKQKTRLYVQEIINILIQNCWTRAFWFGCQCESEPNPFVLLILCSRS